MPYKTLVDMKMGEVKNIRSLSNDEASRRRLMELGFLRDMPVSLELISPFGNPRAYRVAGSLIALRNSDAKRIFVFSPDGERI